ncbi:MAG: hypothetical protein WD851_09315 [Pirellulales bacterium]
MTKLSDLAPETLAARLRETEQAVGADSVAARLIRRALEVALAERAAEPQAEVAHA